MKKRAISLIEVIVSLGLLSLLLSTLFFWYHSLNKQKEDYNHLKGPLMEERYAYQRLQHILNKADCSLFATESGSLVFVFDRGPSPLSDLSGQVLGRLYYDAIHQSLCLGVWPHPKSEKTDPSQTCILLDGVEACSFAFYSPPDPFKKPVDPEEVGNARPTEGWQDEWKSSYKTLPALIKISIARDESKGIKEHTFDYLFDLPVPVVFARRE